MSAKLVELGSYGGKILIPVNQHPGFKCKSGRFFLLQLLPVSRTLTFNLQSTSGSFSGVSRF